MLTISIEVRLQTSEHIREAYSLLSWPKKNAQGQSIKKNGKRFRLCSFTASTKFIWEGITDQLSGIDIS